MVIEGEKDDCPLPTPNGTFLIAHALGAWYTW